MTEHRFQSPVPARTPEIVEKHRRRAIGALAEHVCATDLTDGFCSPELTGGMMSGAVTCPRARSGRDCAVRARSLLEAMESRGCTVVWIFDREIGAQI